MRMRNKKTGKIQTCDMVVITDEQIDGEIASLNRHTFIFRSVEQFNDEYEDYKPTEPLIKDEKIRKAVRAWAEACNLKHVTYKQASNEFYDADTRGAFAIRFTLMPVEVYLEDGESFTIDELCGEEEKPRPVIADGVEYDSYADYLKSRKGEGC